MNKKIALIGVIALISSLVIAVFSACSADVGGKYYKYRNDGYDKIEYYENIKTEPINTSKISLNHTGRMKLKAIKLK